ncbi:MAG: nucleotidyltransferase family protein [Thermomicrobiales bacterium]|nr:nucleotidyltransferase family protein [Thermomicrobiales bacterium]
MSDPRVGIVILAGGTSSRLGRPKQLLELGGEPLLRLTVRRALASSAWEVVLVLGSRAEEIDAAVGELGQRIIMNPDFAAGQSTSMVAGVAVLGADIDAAILMLGDQPTVTPALLDRLIATFAETGAAIIQPRYQGRPGNPVLFRRDLFPELLAVTGDLGAREIIQRRKRDVAWVDLDEPAPPDVDSDDDYEYLKSIWNAE